MNSYKCQKSKFMIPKICLVSHPSEDEKSCFDVMLIENVENTDSVPLHATFVFGPILKLDYIGKSRHHIVVFHVDGKGIQHDKKSIVTGCLSRLPPLQV